MISHFHSLYERLESETIIALRDVKLMPHRKMKKIIESPIGMDETFADADYDQIRNSFSRSSAGYSERDARKGETPVSNVTKEERKKKYGKK